MEYMIRELRANGAGIFEAPKGWRIHSVMNFGRIDKENRAYINALLERSSDDAE
jgi:hypothetical protein